MIAAHETNHDITGLAHLVEAATALTELVDSKQSPAASSKACAKSKAVCQRTIVSDDDDDRREKHTSKSKKREIFPQRLMDILSDRSLSDVVSWLPHGRSFVIIRPDIFTEQVLPKYLPPVDARTSTKYPSFTRKLNRWGFRQATRGPDTGAFHHPFFRRDQPDLCLQMACQKSRERKEQKRSSLPPKKRSVSDKSNKPTGEKSNVARPGPQFATPESRTHSTAPSVSADDRSVTSAGNSSITSTTASDAGADQPPASIGSSASKEETTILPFISNDPAFVAEALRQRDAEEVVRAAKAMLYEAYVKAMRSA